MLEIIAIIALGKSISKIVKEKGLNPTKYVIIMVVMWIGFEILGSLIGAILYGEGMVVYLFALSGAAIGGFLSYQLAKNASAATTVSDEILDADLRNQ